MQAAADLLPPMHVIYGTVGETSPFSVASDASLEDHDTSEADSRAFYESHGRWTCMRSLPLDTLLKTNIINYTHDLKVHLEWTEIDGRQMPIISNYWDVRSNWRELYTELFLLTSATHLRPFQGMYVPNLIGVYAAADGSLKVVTETPHRALDGWTEADAVRTPSHIKREIVQAFEAIHAAGVLHGRPALENMLVTDSGQVCLVDFRHSRCIGTSAEQEAFGIQQCSPEELLWETRVVKYLLDVDGAREKEKQLWDDSDRAKYLEYDVSRGDRRSDDDRLLPDEAMIPGAGRRRVDPRSDKWFDDLNAQIGGRRIEVQPLSLDDVTDAQPISPGAPLTFPILLPPTHIFSPKAQSPSVVADNPSPAPSSEQPPSPPPTPPSRRRRITSVRRDLSKLDHQISRLSSRRRELVREIRSLETEVAPYIRYPSVERLSRSLTPPPPLDPSPTTVGPSMGHGHPYLLPPQASSSTTSLLSIGRKRKAEEVDDDDAPHPASSPVSSLNDGSPRAKRPRKALTIDVQAAQGILSASRHSPKSSAHS